MPDNNPPFATLELDKEEAELLSKWLLLARVETEHDYKEVCAMSSSDPRAVHRASLVLALGAEKAMAEQLSDRLCNQHSSLLEKRERQQQFVEDRKAQLQITRPERTE